MAGAWQSALPQLLAGRYRVLGPVGRGAIAEVVRARDERTGAEVALKIIYPHLRDSRDVVERFRREVDIVRRIQHAHVLAIHDVVDSDGQLFLVMDYHPGGDLADWLARKRRFAPGELRFLAGQLCGALAAAHRAGVVHRDVKPSNVLCGPGPQLEVRLCDFGLARTAELAGLTTANAVLGTPEYMAPEVVTDGHADPRSDVYSLGVMLFEAATGKLPFYGDSPYQLMRQHVDVEAPRARSLAPELPEAIDGAIARALAKDPLDRFATADDLARVMAEDAPPPERALAVAPPAAGVRRRACARCGGWLVDAAAMCADCGARLLRLEHQRGGVAVLVTGPGEVGDKLDAWRQVALYKLLEQLPPGSVSMPRRARRAPRVPFYVARGITEASAAALVEQLEGIHLEARVETRWALAPRELKQKTRVIAVRYMAGASLCGLLNFASWLPKPWPLVLFAGVGAGMCSFLVRAILLSTRAVVRPPPGQRPGAAQRRLADQLQRLQARQDRRLAARILERLAQLEALKRTDVTAAVSDRAAQVVGALAALDARRAADASVSPSPADALAELRREETMRVVLRADLLRAVSRLDGLCLAIARANAARSSDELGRIQNEIEDLTTSVEAAAEVDAVLVEAR